MITLAAAVSLEAAHRPHPDLRRPWLASMWLLAYRSVRCHAAGSSSSSTIGYVGAWSDTTSLGAASVVPMACSKNRRAALTSRRGDEHVDDLAAGALGTALVARRRSLHWDLGSILWDTPHVRPASPLGAGVESSIDAAAVASGRGR